MAPEPDSLREEINRRLTLNLLIQGCAEHAFLTSHYIVRDELAAIDPKLLALYDRFAVYGRLQYWTLLGRLIFGSPRRFWKRATKDAAHPFHSHPILSRHGASLAQASRAWAIERGRAKGIARLRVPSLSMSWLLIRVLSREARHRRRLESLAIRAAATVWGIDEERMDALLTTNVAFGELRPPATFRGQLLRAAAAGYGGVLRREGRLVVVARAQVWPILAHELVKATAELVCMHGLCDLEDEMYARVVGAADLIEYEPWMLQVGPEIWRRLLPLLPDGQPLAVSLMRMARLPAAGLEALVLAVIEKPEWARELLLHLVAEEGDPTA
jgi:hypothetical protein